MINPRHLVRRNGVAPENRRGRGRLLKIRAQPTMADPIAHPVVTAPIPGDDADHHVGHGEEPGALFRQPCGLGQGAQGTSESRLVCANRSVR